MNDNVTAKHDASPKRHGDGNAAAHAIRIIGRPGGDAPFETINQILDHAVQINPEGMVFAEKRHGAWLRLSYGYFAKAVLDYAAGLVRRGVTKGDRVALVADNRMEWALTAFACFRIGAVFVPMYENQKPEEQAYVLRDSGAKIVFIKDDDLRRRVMTVIGDDPPFEDVALLEPPRELNEFLGRDRDDAPTLPDVPAPDDLAMLIYTSGTTGAPKGVMLTHGNIASNVSAVQRLLPMNETDVSLAFLPWAHVYGFSAELLCMMSRGATIAICEGIPKIIDNLAEVRPTILFAVPRIFNKIHDGVRAQMAAKPRVIRWLFDKGLALATRTADAPLGALDAIILWLATTLIFRKVLAKFGGRLKYAVTGSAAIAPEVASFIDALGITVFEGYGMTECSPIISTNSPGVRKAGTVGKPIDGVEVRIDPDTQEILVRGPNVMKGYWGAGGGASRIDEEGFLHTGDMGAIDEGGFLRIIGRTKEQYKLENGKYVVPTPLEEQLKLSPLISNVMLYGDNRPYNVAIVMIDQATLAERWSVTGLGDGDVINRLGAIHGAVKNEIDRLSSDWKSYERPRRFVVIAGDFTQENGLLSQSFKLKRRVAVERFGELIDELYAAEGPASNDAMTTGPVPLSPP